MTLLILIVDVLLVLIYFVVVSLRSQHFIKTVEDGLKAVDDEEQDKVCFIYDR